MGYYAIGAATPPSLASFLKQARSKLESETRKLASRAKKEARGLTRAAEEHIKGKAKEGALDATPAIRAEVRNEVTPYVAAAVGVGIVALVVAIRK